VSDVSARVRIGPAGWSYPDWKGIVYGSPAEGLRVVASLFGCVEVNATFYRVPGERTIEGWLAEVEGRDTVFLFKAWRGFTHGGEHDTGERSRFLRACALCRDAGRLGGVLAQFPFYARRDAGGEETVRRICGELGMFGVFFEFRDPSWLEEEFLAALQGWGGHVCNIDIPGGEDTFNRREDVRGDKAYLRIHGRNRKAWFTKGAARDEKYDYLYSPRELEELEARIRRLADRAELTFVVCNNHYRAKAVVNALQLQARLTGKKPDVPSSLVYAYPGLGHAVRSRGLFIRRAGKEDADFFV